MANDSWIKNTSLAGIDPSKLQMLLTLSEQAKGKSQNELLPFLISAAASAQSSQISFQPKEIDLIVKAMKAGKSPEEVQKIDRLYALLNQYRMS